MSVENTGNRAPRGNHRGRGRVPSLTNPTEGSVGLRPMSQKLTLGATPINSKVIDLCSEAGATLQVKVVGHEIVMSAIVKGTNSSPDVEMFSIKEIKRYIASKKPKVDFDLINWISVRSDRKDDDGVSINTAVRKNLTEIEKLLSGAKSPEEAALAARKNSLLASNDEIARALLILARSNKEAGSNPPADN